MSARRTRGPVSRRHLLLGLAALATGCAMTPAIRHDQLSLLSKGQTPAQVQALLGLPPLAQRSLTVEGRTLELHRYVLMTGSQPEVYVLAYEWGRLLYWGSIPEFKRQADPDLVRAITMMVGV